MCLRLFLCVRMRSEAAWGHCITGRPGGVGKDTPRRLLENICEGTIFTEEECLPTCRTPVSMLNNCFIGAFYRERERGGKQKLDIEKEVSLNIYVHTITCFQ